MTGSKIGPKSSRKRSNQIGSEVSGITLSGVLKPLVSALIGFLKLHG